MAKTLDVRDVTSGVVVHTWQLWHHPTCLLRSNLGSSGKSLTVVGEYSQISFWDDRSSTRDACIVREQSGPRGIAWAMTTLGDDGDLVAAGEDRSLYVYDVRTMKVRARWRSAAKHDIVGLMPSCQPSALRLYVAGIDNEVIPVSLLGGAKGGKHQKAVTTIPADSMDVVMIGDQEDQASVVARTHAPLPVGSRLHESHHLGVKSDARWVGVAVCPSADSDGLLGISDRGSIYSIQDAQYMKASVASQGP